MNFIHFIYRILTSSRLSAATRPLVALAVVALLALGGVYGYTPSHPVPEFAAPAPADDDSLSRYGVAPTVSQTPQDLQRAHPADLKTPSNIKQEIEYDPMNDRYVVHTRIGDQDLDYGIPMSRSDYMDYSERSVRAAYFRELNRKAYEEADKNGQTGEFDLLDMQFSLGPAEKIFGKGGLRVKTQGSASISLGMKRNQIDNPTLSERARDQFTMDFKENIQLNMNAKVGTKMSFDLNYNTEATFDFDANKFKLAFGGEEDDIIQNLEAGNVSMTTGNSLISGGSALFGIKAGLKFGKLNVTALLAKQESTSKTVGSKGGVTSKIYEIEATAYDENRHFFLSQYFRDNYDVWMSQLPLVSSGIEITKIEVWVTNKKSNYDEARNILAWMDLGETSGHIYNSHWTASGSEYPESKANSLYNEIVNSYSGVRDISNVATTLAPLESAYGITGGTDYEKIESARLLSSSEYILNSSLGYISLKSKIDDDMVLAVAFQYTKGGKTYQVGEFSTDNSSSTSQTLMLKLLKSAAGNPTVPTWDLMMKNVYYIGASSLKSTAFTMQVQYMSDTLGVYSNFINEAPIASDLLIKVMNLDRLNASNESHSDGKFDWVEGYTVNSSTGRIYFPVVEPFGSWLASKLGDKATADRYCFYELYDSTLTVAEQIAEKNKFRLKGEYSASSGAEIDLGAMNVARGSVKVTAGGVELVENKDYTVDYTMGVVTILNESVLESGTSVSVSLEDQSTYSLQRKTMMGLDMQYDYSDNLKFGATVMNLSEKPLTTKVTMSDIPINNTIYGFNFKWSKDFMWLTNAVGAIPWVNVTKPSNISVNAEFAQLLAGHSKEISTDGNVYIDDFESSESSIDISSPSSWQLSSTPYDDSGNALFPEASLSNNTDYNAHRALLSWYNVERIFTSQSSSLTPGHIKNDRDQLSDHRVRQVNYDEIYPNKELTYGETGILDVLNLAFYPKERGPYNVTAANINADGELREPTRSWGGMMRSFDVTNFENANYEYIEFWLMDPFVMDSTGSNTGGDLYFNLGEISEDILKDGMKSFENGLSTTAGDTTYTATTVWGRVSRRTSTVYAFDNTSSSHAAQDVGLNGLSTADEHNFPTYSNYVQTLESQVSAETLERWRQDPFSPLNDPAGDNYHFYRGSDWDEAHTSILDRYKHFRGVEGNSPSTSDSGESYSTANRSTPDVEDINSDNTLNEYERYYEYHVSLRPGDMMVGTNYIEAVNDASVTLRNGKRTTVRWYQFKIPIRNYEKRVGSITNFKSIRFMRMYMTGWADEQVLRLASLELVRSDWRNYTASSLADRGFSVAGNGKLATSTVNIEENAGSYPVNYVLPPGIDRVVDPGQSTSTLLNEQAMQVTVSGLEPHDALAVYKNSGLDMRQYESIQLFVHGEALPDNATSLVSGELSLFVRLGSDYKDNYYEYEVPIQLTPAGTYNNNSAQDRLKVWPEANMINLSISKLTGLKKDRNTQKQQALSGVSYTTLYTEYDPDRPQNRMAVIGNPTLSDVSVIMIGVRNNGRTPKSGKIWVNEMRLRGIDEQGGWAAKADATLRVSDIATLAATGSYTSSGFGSIEQSTAERKLTNDYQYTISGQTDLGRWVPEQAKLTANVYYSQSKTVSSPKYDPYNEDLTLDETLDTYADERAKDSIRTLVQTVSRDVNFALSGVKFNIRSKKAKPWDPANFSASYSLNKSSKNNPTTEYEDDRRWKFNLNYSYAPYFTPWTPFQSKKDGKTAAAKKNDKNSQDKGAKDKKKSEGYVSKILGKYTKQFQINWLPNSISLSSAINRTYHEEQLRNVDSYNDGYRIPVTYSKTYTWLRQSSISWDLTKTLKFNFSSATNARIDEPDVPVNRNLYPDEYERWKDTIMTQLWKLGTPVTYNQTFDATWNVPLNMISWFDWTNNSVKYKSSYQWNRGTQIDDATTTGNNIQNSATWQWDGRFNLETLYNKSAFLKKANARFKEKKQQPQSNASQNRNKRNNQKGGLAGKVGPEDKNAPGNVKQKNSFKKDIRIEGKEVSFTHSLKASRVLVSVREKESGRAVGVKWKKVDDNSIRIFNPDTSRALNYTVSVKALPPLDDTWWYKTLQVVARGLMMVRSVQVGYNYQQQTYLPSFLPEVGDALGQHKTSGNAMAPGLGFAFGFDGGEGFTNRAIDNGWLILSDSLTTPAVYSWTKNFTYSAVLEPFPGLKINLSGAHKHNEKQSHQFMYPDLPLTKSGSFQMTTIAFGSAFGGLSSSDDYRSSAFQEFLANRQIIYNRLLSRYEGTLYPTAGFMEEHPQQAGTPYKGVLGSSRLNSSDVLVPAFLAAYTGGDASSISLSAFPAWWKALPNWKISYEGLPAIIPWLGRHFKTFSLSHAYTCTYNVGSYATYANYAENADGLGFTLDVSNDVPVPSSEFNISTVTLSESFAPLIGVNFTTNNNISGNAQWKQTRSLTLNMASAQLVEVVSRDLTIGTGYKWENFGQKMGIVFGGNKKGSGAVNHDLNLKFDITYKNQVSLLRKIEDEYSQATSGNKAWSFRFSGDYQFSRMLKMQLYYNKQINTPLISTSYPTINTDFGLTLAFSLAR